MKTKLLTLALLMLVVAFGITSCDKDEDDDPTVTYNVVLNGAKEVPANPSTATGTATFTYDTITYTLSGSVRYSGFTATNAHIHKGAANVSGGVAFPLTAPFDVSPIVLVSVVLNATQRADLKANLYYINVHSVAYPGGEIRGQLTNP